MELISAIALCCLVYLNWRRFRDWLYPAAVQALLWAFIILWFALAKDDFYPISVYTLGVLVLGVIAFTIGCRVSTRAHQPFLQRNRVCFQLSSKSQWLMILIPVMALPFFVRRANQIAEVIGSGDYLSDLRYGLGVEGEGYGIFVLGMWIAYAAAGIFMLEVCASSSKQRRPAVFRLLLMSLVGLTYGALFAGRNWVLFLIVILIGVPLVLRVVSPLLAASVTASLGLVLFALYAFILKHLGLSVEASLSDSLHLLYEVAELYVIAPIAAFDITTRHSAPLEWGINIFNNFEVVLNRVGFSFPVKPIVQDFVSVPGMVNLHTVYQPYYLDFSLVGVLMFQLAAGVWHGYLYRRATVASPKPIFVMLFGIFLYPLLMQFANDTYMLALNRWVIFSAIFGTVFFFNRKRTGQTLKEPSHAL